MAPLIPEVDDVRKRIAGLLLKEKSKNHTFNYWFRGSREMAMMPYPDDLDDTFCILAALYVYDPTLIGPEVLAKVGKLLEALEVGIGGPYRTWAVDVLSGSPWFDVDIAVNANIAKFLNMLDIRLESTDCFIESRIQEKNLHSPYYPGSFQIAYFISKTYRGKQRNILIESVQDPTNLLQAAMALSTRINLDMIDLKTESMLTDLCEAVTAENIRPAAFCMDPSRDGKKAVSGCRALTAAFIGEALAKYALASGAIEKSVKAAAVFPEHDIFPEINVLESAKARVAQRLPDIPDRTKKVLEKVLRKINNDEIVLLPSRMRDALRPIATISEVFLGDLAAANLYGWIAYALYDDIVDGEVDLGDMPSVLCIANICAREVVSKYIKMDEQIPGMMRMFGRLTEAIDVAFVTELDHLFRDGPEALANRSMGHALPALAVLFAGTCLGPESPEAEFLLEFFRNYLAARQLHDDAHDWKEDLLKGRMNGASVRMYKQMSDWSGKIETGRIPELERFFWHTAIEGVVNDIIGFLNAAREALDALEYECGVIKDRNSLEQMLIRLESAAKRTLEERQKVKDFLEAYSTL